MDLGGYGRYDDAVNSATRAILPRVLSLLPCLSLLHLGVRVDIDLNLSRAIQAHPSIQIATIEYTEDLSLPLMNCLSKVQLNHMSLGTGNFTFRLDHMEQLLISGVELAHLALYAPKIIRDGFHEDWVFPGLRSLEIDIQIGDGVLGFWFPEFVERHPELAEIKFRGNCKGIQWKSTSDILCARTIIEAVDHACLSDSLSLLDITIERPFPPAPPKSDFNTWTVSSLALCISRAAPEVLRLIGSLCPYVTRLTLDMCGAEKSSVHPVCLS